MEGSELINYTSLSKLLGYSPKYLRRGKTLKSKDNQKVVKDFESFCNILAKKYTK